MKKVIEEKVYLTESAKKQFLAIDFSDTFSTTNHQNSIEEICKLIFDFTPKWIRLLFNIRNGFVKLIGLKSAVPSNFNEGFKVDGNIKFFKIFELNNNEVILGANDNHLNFRAIVVNTNSEFYNIKVTTIVKYNNSSGKIYMKIIKPFHRFVVMRMVKNAYKL